MKFEELLDYTLREILEEYCCINNLECGFYYGIARLDDIDQLYEEYNIEEDYNEAFQVESLISDDLVVDWSEDIIDYNRLLNIMKQLGISKKEK